jgi:hypothetical protein
MFIAWQRIRKKKDEEKKTNNKGDIGVTSRTAAATHKVEDGLNHK